MRKTSNMEYKLVILVRDDVKMSKGKTVAQSGHAVCAAINDVGNQCKIKKWREEGETIIAVRVPNLVSMSRIMEIAHRKEVAHGVIMDAGLTEVAPDTITVGYLGPDICEKIDKLSGQLRLL